jgi:hypothetical protein
MRSAIVLLAAMVVIGVVTGAAGVGAHHSITAVYDRSRQVRLDGTVVEFALVNPHPFLVIDVKDGRDAGQWRGEMDNRFELVAIGVAANTFRPGDRIVVTGSRSRTETRALYILRLDRPADGYWYEQVGMSPKVGTR